MHKFLYESDYNDDPEIVHQEYTSAKTSINSRKLPAIFSKIDFEEGSINLDIGGGKYDNVANWMKRTYNATNLVYDPYNRSDEHNSRVINIVREHGGADTVTCSNVLNVIKEEEARLAVLRNCRKYLKPGGTCYITVYENDRDGVGKVTTSGYQLNRRLADYVDEVSEIFRSVTIRNNMIIAR